MPLLNDKFLDKLKDISEGDLIKFTDEGAWVNSRNYKNPDGTPVQQFQIGIELSNGEARTLNLNKISRENLKIRFGKNTATWIGKSASIHLKDGFVGGKDVKILVLLPAEEL